MTTSVILQKTVDALKASYGQNADVLDTARALLARSAVAVNPSTAQLEVVDAYAVRELAPELLKPARFSPLVAPKWEQSDPNDDFDTKLAKAARNMEAFGVGTQIQTGHDGIAGHTAEDLAALVAAHPTLYGGGK